MRFRRRKGWIMGHMHVSKSQKSKVVKEAKLVGS